MHRHVEFVNLFCMFNSEFSIEYLKKLFESALPNGITTEVFRADINKVYRELSCQDVCGKIPAKSPKEAFDRLCVDATLKSALKIAIPHKYEIDFYDLICLSVLMVNEEDEMLTNFLCTEVLQTTTDVNCQSACMYRLRKIVDKQTEKKNAQSNNGIHSSLHNKIIGYDILKDFLDVSMKKGAEIEIDSVKFVNDTKIKIKMTSVEEYMNFDMDFATDVPAESINIELENIDRIISDTLGWEELRYGYIEILPIKEDGIEFSYIHKYTNNPNFKFKCKKMTVTRCNSIF